MLSSIKRKSRNIENIKLIYMTVEWSIKWSLIIIFIA
jgi:hypothetical protein